MINYDHDFFEFFISWTGLISYTCRRLPTNVSLCSRRCFIIEGASSDRLIIKLKGKATALKFLQHISGFTLIRTNDVFTVSL